MRNKKGFTLVELVIVIAVIAILAGVMIGTFASVVKKANESAKMQEMAAQKTEQVAEDIEQKLKNNAWLGWEDFEEKLADIMTETMNSASVKIESSTVKDATTDAVNAAFAKYAASLGTTNTGLTEEQVKYIVETALSKASYSGVTEAQVKAIVNNATTGLSSLSKSQVQSIVEAAQAKNLTLGQVTAAIANAVKDIKDDNISEDDIDAKFAAVEKNLTASIKDLKDSTLTAAEIETLLQKYVSNGTAKGDYSWYNAGATTMAISEDTTKAAEQIVALSTMVEGGTSFAGKTIELPATKENEAIDLSEVDFKPIVDFDGKLVGKTVAKTSGGAGAAEADSVEVEVTAGTTVKVSFDPIYSSLEGRNGKAIIDRYRVESKEQKTAVTYGFVASLVDGGLIENIVFDVEVDATNPENQYTYVGGVVGFLNGGTVRNCKVTGKINGYNRIGGVVGYAKSGTIETVDVSVNITAKTAANKASYANIGGIAGYIAGGEVTIENCIVSEAKNYRGYPDGVNGVAGWINNTDDFADKADTYVTISNVTVDGTKVSGLTDFDKYTQGRYSKKALEERNKKNASEKIINITISIDGTPIALSE